MALTHLTKKNVYLVDLASGSNMNLLPLSIGMIGSYCAQDPDLRAAYDFHYQFLYQDFDKKIKEMSAPSIIGFACYIWNIRGSLRMAQMAKAMYPNAIIVLGGYSIPKEPSRISQFFSRYDFVDVLVHGEGEAAFADVLRSLINTSGPSAMTDELFNVNGISYRTLNKTTGFVQTTSRPKLINVNDIPSPYLNGVFDQLLATYGSKITGGLIETNRGCPYSCTFCDWGNADVNKITRFDIDRVKAEIDWIAKNEVYYLFLADANFGIYRERDMEIAGHLSDSCKAFGSPRHVVTNWAKNKHKRIIDIADRMSVGGIACNLTLAVQSHHKPTLEAIKRNNIKHSEMLLLKKELHDRSIPTYMEVILGLPLETLDSFIAGLDACLTPREGDRFFVYLCQLLENTELAEAASREQYKLQSRVCRHSISNRKFDTGENLEVEEFIVGTSTMTLKEWDQAYLTAYLLTTLYNHRLAFFPMLYLYHVHDLRHTDFIKFLLSIWGHSENNYPHITNGINHIDRQRQLIKDGISYMSELDGTDGLVMLPAAAAAALLASDTDIFYKELYEIVTLFLEQNNTEYDSVILGEVFTYQKARMPSINTSSNSSLHFSTNVPVFFEKLTSGQSAIPITDSSVDVVVIDHNRSSMNLTEFAATLVRGGLAVDLLRLDFVDKKTSVTRSNKRYVERRKIEEINLTKLHEEYRKLTSVNG